MTRSNALRAAHNTPLISNRPDFAATLSELRLTEKSKREVYRALTSPVLDIGSGYEQLAMGLHMIGDSLGERPFVVSCNPQLTDNYACGERSSTARRLKTAIGRLCVDYRVRRTEKTSRVLDY